MCRLSVTPQEISSIAWHWVEDLPVDAAKVEGGLKYFMVMQFVPQLKKAVFPPSCIRRNLSPMQGGPATPLPRRCSQAACFLVAAASRRCHDAG